MLGREVRDQQTLDTLLSASEFTATFSVCLGGWAKDCDLLERPSTGPMVTASLHAK